MITLAEEIRRDAEWLGNESIPDGWVTKAVAAYRSSQLYGKLFAVYAGAMVGKYQEGGTQALAAAILRSPSTVQNHAHAYWLYCELRRNLADYHQARVLWRALPISHWWTAYDIQRAGYEALKYLAMADRHQWSGREMIRNYQADVEAATGGRQPVPFTKAVIKFRAMGDEAALYWDELTEKQKTAVRVWREAFKG